MIILPLALVADGILAPPADGPTSAEKATLASIAQKCSAPVGAVYFTQQAAPMEPTIPFAQSLNNTPAQQCVLDNLPEDWAMKFGIETQALPPVK